MIFEINDEFLEDVQLLINILIFNGGKGISLDEIKKIFEENCDSIINETDIILKMLQIELRNNENRLFIVPNRKIYTQLNLYGITNKLLSLETKEREKLTRFITLYLAEGKNEPISKEKVKFELNEKFGLNLVEKDLRTLERFGYIKLIHNKFVDLGWRLKNSKEFKSFETKFLEFIKRFEKKQVLKDKIRND